MENMGEKSWESPKSKRNGRGMAHILISGRGKNLQKASKKKSTKGKIPWETTPTEGFIQRERGLS